MIKRHARAAREHQRGRRQPRDGSATRETPRRIIQFRLRRVRPEVMGNHLHEVKRDLAVGVITDRERARHTIAKQFATRPERHVRLCDGKPAEQCSDRQ